MRRAHDSERCADPGAGAEPQRGLDMRDRSDVKRVGRELDVGYVLEGSVRRSGNRVRITAQLIDAGTGAHLWADRFDGPLEDVFELQDKIASGVAGAIEPTLQEAETARSTGRPTTDLTAYEYRADPRSA